MKNKIYKYFFYEFLRYFFIALFALAVIVWAVQAVNFLDLVTEDGHAFVTYFSYSFLTISKIITKLIPFCFLVACVLTILKFEKDNELIIIWTSGLNKIYIVNLIFRISLIVMLLQLFFTSIINPKLLNYSRFLLKNSEFQFIPSLLKEKQFNDAIKGLTVFVEEKDEGNKFKNIFIRDDGNNLSTIGSSSSNFAFTVLAKSGNVSEDKKSLVLYDGNIQKLTKNQDTVSIIKFEKTVLNFTGLTTKSISEPKMQETSTLKIFNCIKNNYTSIDMHNCTNSKQSKMDTKIEINKRFGMPVFIPLISLICSFLLSSRRDEKIYNYSKYIYFLICFIVLVFAEIGVRYSGISWTHTAIYYFLPMGILPLAYLSLIRKFKYENLV
tara:strand:+ start:59 stop:1204 length:1146 start_codon:yes stop_codon:yes gene_type:complete